MEATAKYDFKATADDEMSFKKGEQLTVRHTHTHTHTFVINTTHTFLVMNSSQYKKYSNRELLIRCWRHFYGNLCHLDMQHIHNNICIIVCLQDFLMVRQVMKMCYETASCCTNKHLVPIFTGQALQCNLY